MSHSFNSYFYNSVILDGVITNITEIPTYIYFSSETETLQNVSSNSIRYAYDSMNSMLYGKMIKDTNIFKLVRRNPWTHNTVYERYACTCPDLSSRNFYVIASNRAVYKCIDNNYDSPSTIEPTTLDKIPTTLADGYTWQYMYKLSTDELERLSTADWIPVVEDPEMAGNTIPGSIDLITVTNPGTNYNASHTGYITQVLSNTLLRIENDALPYDGAYTGSSIYIMDGPGSNQLSRINDYYSNSSGRYITLETPITDVTLSSTYNIAPTVDIDGNGVGAQARSVVVNDLVSHVEITSRGSGYTWASAEITGNNIHGTGATTNVVMSPIEGHGSDPAAELVSRNLLINIDISGDELATINTPVNFSRYGFIRDLTRWDDPNTQYTEDSFNNTILITASVITGGFQVGDVIRSLTDITKRAKIVSIRDDQTWIARYVGKLPFNALEQVIQEENLSRAQILTVTDPDINYFDSVPMTVRVTSQTTKTIDDTEIINTILEF